MIIAEIRQYARGLLRRHDGDVEFALPEMREWVKEQGRAAELPLLQLAIKVVLEECKRGFNAQVQSDMEARLRARRQADAAQQREQHSSKITRTLDNLAETTLWSVRLHNGKRLGDATAADGEEQAQHHRVLAVGNERDARFYQRLTEELRRRNSDPSATFEKVVPLTVAESIMEDAKHG